jgi:hypothetical protein
MSEPIDDDDPGDTQELREAEAAITRRRQLAEDRDRWQSTMMKMRQMAEQESEHGTWWRELKDLVEEAWQAQAGRRAFVIHSPADLADFIGSLEFETTATVEEERPRASRSGGKAQQQQSRPSHGRAPWD